MFTPRFVNVGCQLFFRAAGVRTATADTISFVRQHVVYRRLLNTTRTTTILTGSGGVHPRQRREGWVRRLRLNFQFILQPMMGRHVTVYSIVHHNSRARANIVPRLTTWCLPIIRLLNVDATNHNVWAHKRIVLWISNGRGATLFRVVAIARRSFAYQNGYERKVLLG